MIRSPMVSCSTGETSKQTKHVLHRKPQSNFKLVIKWGGWPLFLTWALSDGLCTALLPLSHMFLSTALLRQLCYSFPFSHLQFRSLAADSDPGITHTHTRTHNAVFEEGPAIFSTWAYTHTHSCVTAIEKHSDKGLCRIRQYGQHDDKMSFFPPSLSSGVSSLDHPEPGKKSKLIALLLFRWNGNELTQLVGPECGRS